MRRGCALSRGALSVPPFPEQRPYRDHSPMGVGLESCRGSVRSSIDLSACRRRCVFPICTARFPYWRRLGGASPFLFPCVLSTGTECKSRRRRAWPLLPLHIGPDLLPLPSSNCFSNCFSFTRGVPTRYCPPRFRSALRLSSLMMPRSKTPHAPRFAVLALHHSDHCLQRRDIGAVSHRRSRS